VDERVGVVACIYSRVSVASLIEDVHYTRLIPRNSSLMIFICDRELRLCHSLFQLLNVYFCMCSRMVQYSCRRS
jgi:hypothetical protein